MAYWIDDGFDTWPEVIRAGKAATGLYVCCGAWIARGIGNGTVTEPVIPAEVAAMYGTPEWVAKLVTVGLWVNEGSGYRDVRYHAMGNPTAEKVRERKAAKAERQRRWVEKQARQRRASRQSGDASQVASPDIAPALPSTPTGWAGGARARDATRTPHEPTPTPFDDPLQRARYQDEIRQVAEDRTHQVAADRQRAHRGAQLARQAIARQGGP